MIYGLEGCGREAARVPVNVILYRICLNISLSSGIVFYVRD